MGCITWVNSAYEYLVKADRFQIINIAHLIDQDFLLVGVYQEQDLAGMDVEPKEIQGEPIHCAQAVLRGIRDRTG
ncbi:hypothetical protein ACFL27_16265 [candidate division CSSED10-310 bacterium]|uniref:Uncharacterized protein n=1 Tax=candidate division CSSED10-310 bacterium TaxID=2855610 RepID=A0ABV6Z091_UNCC1